jgi:hypothetical protein
MTVHAANKNKNIATIATPAIPRNANGATTFAATLGPVALPGSRAQMGPAPRGGATPSLHTPV